MRFKKLTFLGYPQQNCKFSSADTHRSSAKNKTLLQGKYYINFRNKYTRATTKNVVLVLISLLLTLDKFCVLGSVIVILPDLMFLNILLIDMIRLVQSCSQKITLILIEYIINELPAIKYRFKVNNKDTRTYINIYRRFFSTLQNLLWTIVMMLSFSLVVC